MDFVISFSILANLKSDSYDSIFIIIDCFTKMVSYELVKVTINIVELIKKIIDLVI